MKRADKVRMDKVALLDHGNRCSDGRFDPVLYKLYFFVNPNLITEVHPLETLKDLDKCLYYVVNKIVCKFETFSKKSEPRLFMHPTKFLLVESNVSPNGNNSKGTSWRHKPHLIFWFSRNYKFKLKNCNKKLPLHEILNECPFLNSILEMSKHLSKLSRSQLKARIKRLNIFELEQPPKAFKTKNHLFKKLMHFYYFAQVDRFRDTFTSTINNTRVVGCSDL